MTVTDHTAPSVPPAPSGPRPGARVLGALLLLRFTAIGVGVAATCGLLALLGGGAAAWTTAVTYSAIPVVVVADVATVATLAVVLRREGRRLRDLLGPSGPGGTAWRAVVAFVVAYVAFGLGSGLGGYAGALVGGPAAGGGVITQIPLWFGLWNLLVLPVTAGIAEEYVYRGYLQPRLAARIGTPAAIVVVAAAFALQHVWLAAYSLQDVVVKLVATFVFGIAFGLLYRWFRRLLPLILAHWLLDVLGIGLPMLWVAVRG